MVNVPLRRLEFPINPSDYSETRSEQQLDADGEIAHRQLIRLTPGPENHERLNGITQQIRAIQDAEGTGNPLPFDVYPTRTASGRDTSVLVARGQLVVRTAPPATEGSAPRRGADNAYRRRVTTLLGDLGYELAPRGADERGSLQDSRTEVFQTVADRPWPPDRVARDLARLRFAGIPAQVNVLVAAGQSTVNPIVKGDDLPERTEGLGRFTTATSGIRTAKLPRKPKQVRVAVIDTGAPETDRKDGWLPGSAPTEADREHPDIAPGNGRLDWLSGHGTFCGGVVQRVAPRVEVRIYRCTSNCGLSTDKDVAETMLRAVADAADDEVHLVVNASLAAPSVAGVPPLAMRDAVDLIHARGSDVVVAAAGNEGASEPMYPAAFRGVIATGALDADGRPASFSNFGPWVTCSTIGVGIVSTFIPGMLPPESDPTVPDYEFGLDPFAVWTGTSFAAPQISGAVARLSYDNQITPREAVAALLDGRLDLPNYGRVVRLLPGTRVSKAWGVP